MLISQRIAKDPNFLHSEISDNMNKLFSKEVIINEKEFIQETRIKIIKSIKFLIGTYLFNNETVNDDILNTLFNTTTPTAQAIDKKENIWKVYSKLAYPIMFLENEEAALLIYKTTLGWSAIWIKNDGLVSSFIIEVVTTDENRNYGFTSRHPVREMMQSRLKKYGKVPVILEAFKVLDKVDNDTKLVTISLTMIVSELLTFINTCNTRIHSYKPTQNENAVVPKPLLPFYEYKTLDLYREKTKFNSLDEIVKFSSDLCLGKTVNGKRTHLVRGHFKEKNKGTDKAKLYWWNPFVRCRNNLDTLGVVEKGYNVVDS